MEQWHGKVAFVTGASSGIGKAIVEKLTERGIKVIGFARRLGRLEELGKTVSANKGKFYPVQGDVANEDNVLKAFQWVKSNVGPISILVNNAGLLRMDNISESNTQNWRDVIDVNVLGVCIATREAIKQMKENNIDGQIININSVAGHKAVTTPRLNLYPASKCAVTALTETLRLELAGQDSKIKVTSLSPGGVKTELALDSLLKMGLTKENSAAKVLNASDVADATIYILSTPKHVNISELTIQAVGETF